MEVEPPAPQNTDRVSDERVERVRRLVAPWATGDFTAAIALLADGVEMSAYQPEGQLTFVGREQVVRFMVEFGSHWENYRVEADEVEPLGDDAVLVAGRQIGTGVTSGLEISEPVFIVLRLHGDQIAGQYWHVDREKALEAARLA